jgi:hypothetical protein
VQPTVDLLGWMRSTEEPGHVPGARIPLAAPADGEFEGWHFEWARQNTLIEWFENARVEEAALSGSFTREIFGLAEPMYPGGVAVNFDEVWDGGTAEQHFDGYTTEAVAGGWASWQHVNVPDALMSPETRDNTPGVYSPWHYSLRRFTCYFTVTCPQNIAHAYLESQFPPDEVGDYKFPLNDSAFVFVNGKLVFWSSTDILGSQTTLPIRTNFYGVHGEPLGEDPNLRITDGWYMPVAGPEHFGNIAPYLREGKNIVDVITDDFYWGGGMAKLDLIIETPQGRVVYRS